MGQFYFVYNSLKLRQQFEKERKQAVYCSEIIASLWANYIGIRGVEVGSQQINLHYVQS